MKMGNITNEKIWVTKIAHTIKEHQKQWEAGKNTERDERRRHAKGKKKIQTKATNIQDTKHRKDPKLQIYKIQPIMDRTHKETNNLPCKT